jgi:hypothetical protein
MRTVNVSQANEADIKVTDFWEQRYLPFVEENLSRAPSRATGKSGISTSKLTSGR